MKKVSDKVITGILATIAIVLIVGSLWTRTCVTACASTPEIVESNPVVEAYTVPLAEDMVDVSFLNSWCGGFSDGAIRMIGAWYYSDGVVEDEKGTLWATDLPITQEDFLLLWITDNHTPDDPTDDQLLKVWAEVY